MSSFFETAARDGRRTGQRALLAAAGVALLIGLALTACASAAPPEGPEAAVPAADETSSAATVAAAATDVPEPPPPTATDVPEPPPPTAIDAEPTVAAVGGPELPLQIQQFVPDGLEPLSTTFGLLDGDAVDDVVLVLRALDEEEDRTQPRPVLLLLGQDNGEYKLAARNDDVVHCRSCGGLKGAFGDVVITNRYFSFEQMGGSRHTWFRVTTFRYDTESDQWQLTGDASEVIDTIDPELPVELLQHSNPAGTTFETYSHGAQ